MNFAAIYWTVPASIFLLLSFLHFACAFCAQVSPGVFGLKMDVHADNLSMCCRVSGQNFSARSIGTTYKDADYHEQLRTVFRVDVAKDDPSVHPKSFCHTCKSVLDRCPRAASSSFSGGGCGTVRNKLPHSRTNCELCQPAKCGRKPKRKKVTLTTS